MNKKTALIQRGRIHFKLLSSHPSSGGMGLWVKIRWVMPTIISDPHHKAEAIHPF